MKKEIKLKEIDEQDKNNRLAIKVSVFSICCNVFLSFFKLLAGIFGMSYAMISDAVHSLSDVFTTFIVIVGVKISSKKADRGHPFGHERFESVAALVLSFILLDVGLVIGISAIQSLVTKAYLTNQFPKLIALIAAIVSILMQLMLFIVTSRVAKKINSGSLKADAWHHLSDSLSSIGSFVGILGAMLGIYILDVIAGLLIALIIIKVAVEIFIDSIKKMTDTSADEKLESQVRDVVQKVDGVISVDLLRTRQFGNRLYIEVEISCDGELKLVEAHSIAQEVHDKIEEEFKVVKHCMIHVNPFRSE